MNKWMIWGVFTHYFRKHPNGGGPSDPGLVSRKWPKSHVDPDIDVSNNLPRYTCGAFEQRQQDMCGHSMILVGQ